MKRYISLLIVIFILLGTANYSFANTAAVNSETNSVTLPIRADSTFGSGQFSIKFADAKELDNWILTATEGQWGINDGYITYPVSGDNSFSMALYKPIGDTSDDITVSAKIRMISEGFHGFALRCHTTGTDNKDNSFYAVGIDYENRFSTIEVLKFVDGKVAACSYDTGLTTALNTDYILEGDITENLLTVSLKDNTNKLIKKFSWKDTDIKSSFTHGYIGLVNERSACSFKDMQINMREPGTLEKGYIVQYKDTGILAMDTVVGNTMGDVSASATISLTADGLHGFVFRRPTLGRVLEDNDFYFLGIDYKDNNAALKIIKYVNGKITVSGASSSFAVKKSTNYVLYAAATGNTLRIALKSKGAAIKTLYWKDTGKTPLYTHGYIGFMNGAACGLSNFRVNYCPINTDRIKETADWIMAAITPDGAIANQQDLLHVRPYLSHFGALGLVRAAEVTSDKSYSDAAWKWLDWYYKHMNKTGFVCDYDLKGGKWASTGNMDSTDSYAAMYLVVLNELWNTTRDTKRLTALKPSISKAVDAINATMDSDHLTWAKPGWKVKYLMDVSEAYCGLKAAYDLAVLTGNKALAGRVKRMKDGMYNGIESMWNEASSDYARCITDKLCPCEWKYFYSDAVSEVWPVAFGAAGETRSLKLLKTFESKFPGWDKPEQLQLFRDGGKQKIYYWPVIGWTYQKLGNFERANRAADNIYQAAMDANTKWPYNTMIAGEMIILLSGGY